MKREIKFRTWNGVAFDYSPMIWDGMEWDSRMDCEVTGVILSQFTGLKDKNGVEIYDGDLVKYYSKGNYITCEIVWNELGMWSLKHSDGYINNYHLNASSYEVVGNIHESK